VFGQLVGSVFLFFIVAIDYHKGLWTVNQKNNINVPRGTLVGTVYAALILISVISVSSLARGFDGRMLVALFRAPENAERLTLAFSRFCLGHS